MGKPSACHSVGSAAADPQGYAVPQYDLMDMMVRDVPYEEVGEESRRDEVRHLRAIVERE